MAKIVWDATGKRKFETGVDHAVLYVQKADGSYDKGVAWNGITGVTASPDGAEPNDLWADNMKYATLRSTETFGATIEAYTYPDEFMQCDGSAVYVPGVYIGQQSRQPFGFCYRTLEGSDIDPDLGNDDNNYRIHIIYNATASPSERSYETVNDSPDAITFSWEITTTPVNVTGYKPVSELTFDMAELTAQQRTALINLLYGTDADATNNIEATEPTLLAPDALLRQVFGTPGSH